VSVLAVLAGPLRFTNVSVATLGLLAEAHLLFAMGVVASALWVPQADRGAARIGEDALAPFRVPLLRAVVASALLGLLGRFLSLVELVRSGDILILLSSPSTFREMALSDQLHITIVARVLSAFNFSAAAFSGAYVGMFRRPRALLLVPLLGLLASFVTDAGRAELVWGIMLLGSAYLIGRVQIRARLLGWRDVAAAASLGLGFLVVLAALRVLRGGALEGTYEFTRMRYGNVMRYGGNGLISTLLANVVSYFSGPVPALSHALDGGPSLPMLGRYTFRPLFAALGGETGSSLFPETFIPFPFNVFTHLYMLWLDFGALGVGAFHLVVGILAGALYARMEAKPSLFIFVLLAFVYTFLGFSLFLPLTYATTYWVAIALTAAMAVTIARRRPRWSGT